MLMSCLATPTLPQYSGNPNIDSRIHATWDARPHHNPNTLFSTVRSLLSQSSTTVNDRQAMKRSGRTRRQPSSSISCLLCLIRVVSV